MKQGSAGRSFKLVLHFIFQGEPQLDQKQSDVCLRGPKAKSKLCLAMLWAGFGYAQVPILLVPYGILKPISLSLNGLSGFQSLKHVSLTCFESFGQLFPIATVWLVVRKQLKINPGHMEAAFNQSVC